MNPPPARKADLPLPLWRVLEDEYRELHATGTRDEWQKKWQEQRDKVSQASKGAAPTDTQLEAALHNLVHQLPDDQARTAVDEPFEKKHWPVIEDHDVSETG